MESLFDKVARSQTFFCDSKYQVDVKIYTYCNTAVNTITNIY